MKTTPTLSIKSIAAAALLGCVLAGGVSRAATYYVDGPGGAGSGGSDSNNGTSLSSAWATLGKANTVLQAGDTVFIRGGSYSGQKIDPNNSGSAAGGYITYAAYQSEAPIVSNPPAVGGEKTAILLEGNNYIKVDGVDVDGSQLFPNASVDHFATLSNADHNIVQNCNFKYANGYVGFEIGDGSQYNQVLNNSMDFVGTYRHPDYPSENRPEPETGDLLSIAQGASYNLVAGNSFKHGGHDLLAVTGNFNAIVDNDFNNDWSGVVAQGQVAPAGTGYRSVVLTAKNAGATDGRNLFEGNIVTGSGPDLRDVIPASMKVEGTAQIVRGNFYFDNDAEAMSSAIRDPKIPNARLNRIYNNTIFGNGGAAWWTYDYSNLTGRLDDNVFKNNLVYNNRLMASGNSDVEIQISGAGGDVLEGNLFINNSFLKTSEANGGDAMFYVLNDGNKNTREWFEANKAANFADNIEQNPDFVTATGPRNTREEFDLQSNSPMIDAGAHLTTAVGSGSNSTSLTVADSGYFFARIRHDNITIRAGDTIRIGGSSPVEVTAANYSTGVLTLAAGRTWSGGAGVSLDYEGAKPDIGARERSAAPSAPAAPSNLTATPLSSSQIDLAWTDNASNETGFKLERQTGSGSFAQIATPGANATSFSNTGLSAGTAYSYRIRATNGTGDSAFSNTVTATTSGGVTITTYEAENLAIAASSGDTTETSANASASAGNFRLYRSNAVGDFITYTVNAPQAGTYTIKSIVAKNRYRSIFQLAIDGTNAGPTHDPYASTTPPVTFAQFTLATGVSLTAGNHAFKFTATGKNAASLDYQIALDTIVLERTGP